VIAAIGDIRRFKSAKRLVGYLGPDARVRQSGLAAARHGHISKKGTSAARHVLVQAAWAAIKTPGPLRAFYQRIRGRRGACRRAKLAMLCWQLLTTGQDYAYQHPTLVTRKLRTLKLRADAPHTTTTSRAPRASTAKQRAAHERQLAEQAKLAYRRRRRLQRDRPEQACGRRTETRITKAVKRPSSAARTSPRTCALARGHPHHQQRPQTAKKSSMPP
jgi:transposase